MHEALRPEFKTQRELYKETGDKKCGPIRPPEYDEIMIVIGRNGGMYLETCGRHRLFISRIIGLSKVPVRVLIRHKKWQEKRYLIANKPKKDLTEDLRKLLSHPDMQDVI